MNNFSITSGGDVLDISERVVRVSFAPAVATSEDDRSIGKFTYSGVHRVLSGYHLHQQWLPVRMIGQ